MSNNLTVSKTNRRCIMSKHKSRHHRRPRSNGGVRSKRNISTVSSKQHQAWHTLFANYTPKTIAEIINAIWIDPDFEFIVVERGEAYEKARQKQNEAVMCILSQGVS